MFEGAWYAIEQCAKHEGVTFHLPDIDSKMFVFVSERP